MAKLKVDKTEPVFLKYGDKIVFVLNNLDNQQQKHLDEISVSSDELWSFVDRAYEAGFFLSVKYDAYSKSAQATMVCNMIGGNNEGLAVSGRSTHGAADAVLVCWYKIAVIAEWDLRSCVDEKPEGRGRR